MDRMKELSRRIMRVVPVMVAAITIAVLLIDAWAPLELATSMLYVLPLLLTFVLPNRSLSFVYAALATACMWAVFLLKPTVEASPYALVNRVLGTVVLWVIATGLVRYRRAQDELKSERVERAHAEGLMIEAREARSLAHEAEQGAKAGQRVAEKKLLVSQLRLDSIIHSAMDAIITTDQEQNVILFNRAAEQMFGCTAEEAVGRPLDRFLPARFREAHRQQVQAFGQSNVTSRKMGKLGTVVGLRSTGEEFPIEAAISHVSIEGTRYYTVILRDITEHQRVLEELRRQHAFIEAVLETVAALVVVLDREGRILRFNRACEQATGYSSEEVRGRVVWDFLVGPEEVASVKSVFGRLLAGELHHHEHEHDWVGKDGRRRRIAWANTVMTDAEGRADCVVATGIDVTELKQIQEQLRRTERIAELGTLASGMAHEIGTPMNVILGRAEYMMDRVSDESIRKGLKTIIAQVERITRVMNQLLAFARRKPPERRLLSLKDIIEDGMELFRERLDRNRVTVELTVDDRCPSVMADADQMSQVFINLVANAIHAMPQGGTLRVGLTQDQNAVTLTVSDTGHGIPREVLPKIFDPFFTTKEFGKGTGLGLTVVKGIIEEHRGTITVESEEGKGTTFTVSLPKSL
ncbi:MAG: PAS domain S-box protein [Nitrospira sp.]|nr:PAS domain S-box protein [Nitrospira sp.]